MTWGYGQEEDTCSNLAKLSFKEDQNGSFNMPFPKGNQDVITRQCHVTTRSPVQRKVPTCGAFLTIRKMGGQKAVKYE